MKILKTIGLAGALVTGAAFSYQASAVIVDFTDASWGPGGTQSVDQSLASLGGIQVTVSSLPISTTTLFWDNVDGFGVNGPGDSTAYSDEIEFHDGDNTIEQIAIHFSAPVTVNGFTVSDFFQLTGLNGGDEVGQVIYNGGAFQSFTSTVPQAGDPKQGIPIGAAGVTDIVFQAGDIASDFAIHDLNVDVAPVPLPPAVWLLGSAMVFLFRKRQAS